MNGLRPPHARLILVAAVLLVMGRLVVCDFTWWDDQTTVHQNPQMRVVGLDTFVDNWTKPKASIYIPLTYTVWALVAIAAKVEPDAAGITLNPWFFHATNVAVHVGGAMAAWALLRRLVKNDVAALLGALLWAVHPVQVESVGWVSGLKDVLSGTLVLTAMALYVRWRQEGGCRSYGLALLVFALALLAKASAFTMPLLLVTLDRLVFGASWRSTLKAVAAFVLVSVPVAVVARVAQPSPMTPASIAPLWLRPLIAGDSLAFYLVKVVAPLRSGIDYGRTPVAVRESGIVWVGWLLPAAVAAAALLFYQRRRRQNRAAGPLPAIGLLWFALAPLHVLGLTRFDFQTMSTVADHYLYVAMIGPALLLAWAVSLRPTRAVVGVVTLCVAGYAARAAWQTPAWQDEGTLVRQALAVNPRSWSAYVNLAIYDESLGETRDQQANLETALRLAPDNLYGQVGLLDLHARAGRSAVARTYAEQIVGLFRQVFGDDPGTVMGCAYVFDAFFTLDELDDAEAYLKRGEARSPDSPDLRKRRTLLDWRRRDLASQGRRAS